ncbi:Dynein light chain roadblock-type 1 [Colletotrichum orbiculare MAFF 240422]|uniref:Dynein light chain roadblock-type 1 n=2 Tax=Colletotrichum orbiculare species complex TaxID=2707354 RepID=N4VST3_COLOR|nr:Dynein light chain roadblock-type 1 [Colletotrichum orbiculare MAFF 240422]TDZ34169.1 Dynein light chain roadblock-type 1 [Colletotrichum spinosum]
MADSVPVNGPDALDETLNRLSKKPGVKAVVILDRATGAILRTTGQLSFNAAALPSSGSFSGEGAAAQQQPPQQQQLQQQSNGEINDQQPQGLEDFAAKVWNWVNASGTLVMDLDTEDELKLLRLRTKKQELVIVPDPKYLLIVVHDTPPA